MRTVNNQKYAKYRDQQMAYKKQFYKEKNKYSIMLSKCKIRGLSKYTTNKLIKFALQKKQIVIELNEKTRMSIEEFYNKHKLNDKFKVVEIDGIFEKDSGFSYCCDVDKVDILTYLDDENYNLVLCFWGSQYFS